MDGTQGILEAADHGRVSLRPVQEADMAFLFRLLGDPERSHLWMRERLVGNCGK